MKAKRLNSKNKLYTSDSGTTVYVDYSFKDKILEVEFAAGKVYHYQKVSPQVWKEYKQLILSGGSSGEFVNKEIKPKYSYNQIT